MQLHAATASSFIPAAILLARAFVCNLPERIFGYTEPV
jgi:hypothetical protein